MRYARIKQLALYVYQGNTNQYKKFKKVRGTMGNLKIEENVTLAPYCDQLDPTFMWHRHYNNVSFDVTHYYPHKATVPLYVDLYKVDSVYY